MAIYNEILVGRFARGVQKLFGLKGEVPTKQLSGEIMVVNLLDSFMNLENRSHVGWRSYATSQTVAAGGAGTIAGFRMRNPAGSNQVVVLEKITFSSSLSDAPFVNRGPSNSADLLTPLATFSQQRDIRFGGVASVLIGSTGVPAARTGVTWYQGAQGANTALEVLVYENQELVIAPTDCVTLYSGTVNQNLLVNVFWRERNIEEQENFPL